MAAQVRDELASLLRPGIATKDLDTYAEERIGRLGGKPAFKGYRGYPASVCVSVNEEVIHGIPGSRKIRDGDIVSLDLGVWYSGFYADTAICEPVGHVDLAALNLIRAAREAFEAGAAKVRVGGRVSDISHAVQVRAERDGFSVVREFVGHGIGRMMHEEPQIPNYGAPGQGLMLKAGQALAIEPMINEGSPAVRVLEDGWTTVTVDGRRSAHHEHTVLVTETGPEILTVAAA